MSATTHVGSGVSQSEGGATAVQAAPVASHRPVEMAARLVGFGSRAAVDCVATDFNPEGLFVLVAGESRLCVGERYEVVFTDKVHGLTADDSLPDGCYATVVHTEHCTRSGAAAIGAGLRFDRPLLV